MEQADEALLRARGQKLAVEQAQRGFEIASAQYREGLGSQLELTDAEVALRQSEFNYAQAVYDYLVARAQLDQATGQVPLVDVDWSRAAASEDWTGSNDVETTRMNDDGGVRGAAGRWRWPAPWPAAARPRRTARRTPARRGFARVINVEVRELAAAAVRGRDPAHRLACAPTRTSRCRPRRAA